MTAIRPGQRVRVGRLAERAHFRTCASGRRGVVLAPSVCLGAATVMLSGPPPDGGREIVQELHPGVVVVACSEDEAWI